MAWLLLVGSAQMQAAAEGDDDDEIIFLYTGGDQVVPRDVRRVRIDKSVKIIPAEAFFFIATA
jgi:hypothetical protein